MLTVLADGARAQAMHPSIMRVVHGLMGGAVTLVGSDLVRRTACHSQHCPPSNRHTQTHTQSYIQSHTHITL